MKIDHGSAVFRAAEHLFLSKRLNRIAHIKISNHEQYKFCNVAAKRNE